MEFKEPKPAPKVEEFVRNGSRACALLRRRDQRRRHPQPVRHPRARGHKARVPAGFPLVNLGAWNDDPIVIQAIKEKVEAQMHS